MVQYAMDPLYYAKLNPDWEKGRYRILCKMHGCRVVLHDAARRPTRRSAAWVVVRGGWRRLTLMLSHAAFYFFYKIDIGRRRFADVLACSDVADF